MLYGKIYLDRDTDGQTMLVFTERAAQGIEANRACMVDYIAISPEAREALRARFEDDTMYDMVDGESEFFMNFFGEYFSFMPDCVKRFVEDENADLPYYEDCGTERRLRMDERFSYYMGNGSPLTWSLDDMTEADNAFLKALALLHPVNLK